MGRGDVRRHRARRGHRGRGVADRRGSARAAHPAAGELPLVHAVRGHADSVADRERNVDVEHDHHDCNDVVDDVHVQPGAGELPDAAAAAHVNADSGAVVDGYDYDWNRHGDADAHTGADTDSLADPDACSDADSLTLSSAASASARSAAA